MRQSSAAPLAPQQTKPNSSIKDQARELLQTEISFVPSPEFGKGSSALQSLEYAGVISHYQPSPAPAELPAHLQRMCEIPLLSKEDEQTLFKEMNYLKFKANALRSRVDPSKVNKKQLTEIRDLLAEASTIQQHLLMANMRLVMSIAKKFVNQKHNFDDLLSEGYFCLVQAVEKFDYMRGYRFSTYAYRSIVRALYRVVTSTHKEDLLLTQVADDWPFETEDNSHSQSLSDQVWSNLRDITGGFLDSLDQREQMIIRCRYALGSEHKVTTFQALADKLNVSKERVRQLEQRAVKKLKALASAYDVDELFTAAMV